MVPSLSVEVSLKVACWPVWGVAGATVKEAVGAWLGGGGGGGGAVPPRRTQRATEGTPSAFSTKSM